MQGTPRVLAEFGRFAAPLPSAPAQKAGPDVIDPALQKTATHIWAAHYSSMVDEVPSKRERWPEVFAAHSAFRWWTRRVRVSTPASTHRVSLEIGH